MKTCSLALALLAMCSGVAAQEAPRGEALGNPEMEGLVAACAKAVEQRAAAYRALLDEPLSCGTRLAKGPLLARSSEQYRARVDQASRRIVQESRADHQGIRGACESMALACIDRHPGLSPAQKMTAMQAIAVDGAN
ncbi:hypothetical protein [Pseudoduganella albidiflava]|uniref:Lysozyme inhibitor LprI N-terminal domain-containing protein n=1 Tax=Pseudoduganella albidiflava TaxID=321983 RepID=A0A411WSJ2_9BURK|nr:hypothetical protein [Pseudoduganella albidiflava]QBH99643.1 hypothetical protein EYF70_01375 [Pseudoduganella albidiflava]GGY46478.1 hypothetical protein GCM10007387_30770 [Pseudoduganella albidiflava]